LGTSWELRGKNLGKTWEKLGTFSNGYQPVTNLFGNFVGKTWEKLGKKYPIKHKL
jgi:hypothetical protein